MVLHRKYAESREAAAAVPDELDPELAGASWVAVHSLRARKSTCCRHGTEVFATDATDSIRLRGADALPATCAHARVHAFMCSERACKGPNYAS